MKAPARVVIGLIAALAASGCQSGPDQQAAGAAAPSRSAAGETTSTVEGSFTADRFQVPLPPGRWQVAYSQEEKLDAGRAWRHVLVKVHGSVVYQAVLIYRSELDGGQRYRPREACRYEGYFYSAETEIGRGAGDCRQVRAVSFGLAGPPNPVSLVFQAIRDKYQYFAPAAMLGSRHIRFAGRDQLQVDYLWTPELLLPPEAGSVWRAQDWSNEAVRQDGRKLAIMKNLQRWSDDWHPRVVSAFPI